MITYGRYGNGEVWVECRTRCSLRSGRGTRVDYVNMTYERKRSKNMVRLDEERTFLIYNS